MEGFEADDLIGTVAKMADKEGIGAYIITGDKDALQLVSENTMRSDNQKRDNRF